MGKLAVGVGGWNVGFDVDDRRPDELGDDLQDGRLGFEHLDVAIQFAAQFRPRFGPDLGGLLESRRQGRRRLRSGRGGKRENKGENEAEANCRRPEEEPAESGPTGPREDVVTQRQPTKSQCPVFSRFITTVAGCRGFHSPSLPAPSPQINHHDTSSSMSLIDRSVSPPEVSSRRPQSTSEEADVPWRSASR